MSGRSRSYKDGLYRRLRENSEAANYLQAAREDSQAAFLVALKNVLEARNVAAVARASKLNREHIYRMLSEGGNPTLSSLDKILQALGLKLAIELHGTEPQPTAVSSQSFHMSWNTALVRKRNSSVYGVGSCNSSSAPKPGMIGCEEMLGASAESVYAEIPHPAFLPACEEPYKMAS